MSAYGFGIFRAVLLRDPATPPQTLSLPSEVDVPPSRLRVPCEFEGASAFEVFELADDRSWPEEAVFQLVATVPRSTDELQPGERSDWEIGGFDPEPGPHD